MTTEPEESVGWLLSELEEFEYPWGRSVPAAWERLSSPGSTVYRVALDGAGRRRTVFVKLIRQKRAATELVAERLAEEYRHLRRLSERFAGADGLSVVRALGLTAQRAGLVTEGVEGRDLQALIGEAGRVFGRADETSLLRACEAAGRFLARLHEEQMGPVDTAFREDVYRYCDDRIEHLRRVDRFRLSGDEAAAVRSALTQALDDMEAGTMPMVFCHLDFAPHNIIVRGERLWVLDFFWSDRAPAEFDLACFLEKLRDLRYEPFYPASLAASMERRFVAGYGSSPEEGSPAYQVAKLRLVLSKLATMSGAARERRPDRWLSQRRRSHAYLRWLLGGFARRTGPGGRDLTSQARDAGR